MSGPGSAATVIARALALAERLEAAGRSGEAEQVCRNLLAQVPDAPNVLNFLALLVKARGRFEEAEALLRRALTSAPREAVLHNNLGNLLRRKNDLAGAEKSFRQAVALKRDYPDAYYNLGITLQDLGRNEEALAAQRRATALRPAYPDALTQVAALLIEKKDFAEALSAVDAVLRSNPSHFGAVYYRGVALLELERHNEAIETLRRAVSLRPQSHQAHHALGNALLRAHREDEALETYLRVVDLAPDFMPAHYDHSSVAWTTGRADRAFDSYARAREAVGEHPDLLLAEASLRLRLKDAAAAEDLARRAHAVAPSRCDIANLLAQTLATQKRFDESIPLLHEAVRAEPEQISHYRELGIVLLQDRQPAAAKTVLEEALRLAPYDQLILAHLTLACRELGDTGAEFLADVEKYVRVYDVPPPDGFGDVEAFNVALAQELTNLHTLRVEPFDQTLRGGTQTSGQLFERKIPAVAGLRDRIRQVIADYVRDLPDDASHPFLARKTDRFGFAGSWSCRLRSNGFHTNHVHPEGWISSAYYVSLPAAVTGGEGEQGWIKFGESNLELGARDRPERTVKPAVGKLVLFPSYFWHGTVPFSDEASRLTVAFDVAPRA